MVSDDAVSILKQILIQVEQQTRLLETIAGFSPEDPLEAVSGDGVDPRMRLALSLVLDPLYRKKDGSLHISNIASRCRIDRRTLMRSETFQLARQQIEGNVRDRGVSRNECDFLDGE